MIDVEAAYIAKLDVGTGQKLAKAGRKAHEAL